jgi:hypothetical protein
MTDKAAIKAAYCDLRPVRTRKVLQLILEVPPEQAQLVTDALGWPSPGQEGWVALARLKEPPVSVGAGVGEGGERSDSADAPSPSSRYADLSVGQQVALTCQQDTFRAYLAAMGAKPMETPDDAEEFVKKLFRVDSKSAIPHEGWDDMHEQFSRWMNFEGR